MRASVAIAILLAGCVPVAAGRAPAPIRWDPPVEIAAGGGERGPWRQNHSRYDFVDDPSVALDPSGIVVAWVDHRDKDVFVQRLDAAGRPRAAPQRPRRGPPVNVSRTPAVFSWVPRVVVAGGDVFVAWQEIIFSGGSHGGDILFARSLDGGAAFEAPINLSRSTGGDGKARIDAETWHNGSLDLARAPDGTLHAAWTEYDGQLWVARSTDRGASFTAPVALVADPGRPARAPALAAAADAVYLAWTVGEDRGADLRLAVSRDGGATFSAPAIVAPTPTFSDAPALAVDRDGIVHLAYAESAGGPLDAHHVRYARSRDRGRTFEVSRELSRPYPEGTTSAAFPALALDDRGAVHVLWEVYRDPRELARGLAIASSSDGGATFSAPARVPGTADPGGASNGSFRGRLTRKLAAAAGALAVVNSSLARGRGSRVWLVRGALRDLTDPLMPNA